VTDPVNGGAVAPAPPIAAAAPPIPPWFRAVVWDSLLGGLCPLLPLPFVDDIVLGRVRRRMVEGIARRSGVTLTSAQVAYLAGGGRGNSLPRFLLKAVLYPFKEILRKIFYFLAIKDAADTFSLLFHQGYLLQRALAGGALRRGGPVDEWPVQWVTGAIHGTLAAVDTRPLRRLLRGALRNSERLFAATLRWLGTRLRGRAAAGEVAAVADEAVTRPALGSPEAEQLLDRMLLVLWGEKGYLERLDAELDRRLQPG
jgi:hypothetical protein